MKSKQGKPPESDPLSDEAIDYEVLPFSPKEADALKECLRKIASPEAAASCWNDVHEVAVRTTDRMRREAIKPMRHRAGQALRRIARSDKPILPDNLEILACMALGANRLSLIPLSEWSYPSTYAISLSKLTPKQLRESAEAALKEPLILGGKQPLITSDKGGRPAAAALNDYIAALLRIYEQACGHVPEMRIEEGPVLKFVTLCVAPKIFGFNDHKHPSLAIQNAVWRMFKSK